MSAPAKLSPGSLGGLKTRKASEDRSLPSLCIYGGPGIGKTTLAASAIEVPEMNPILHLNIENGTGSIKEIYPDLEIIDITKFSELQTAYNALYKQRNYDNQTCAGYKTVILDNLTEGQKKGMEHIYEADNLSSQGISFTDFIMPSFANQGWNISSEQMRKLIRAFRELPCYVIFVAWEIDIDKGENRHLWTPAFTAKLANEAPGMMNDVYRYYLDRDGVRTLGTSREKDRIAKDRTRLLPKNIPDPSMQVIYDYWNGLRVKDPEEDKKPLAGGGMKRKA
jgi:hypothetical protein